MLFFPISNYLVQHRANGLEFGPLSSESLVMKENDMVRQVSFQTVYANNVVDSTVPWRGDGVNNTLIVTLVITFLISIRWQD